jgi:hypothetical protein
MLAPLHPGKALGCLGQGKRESISGRIWCRAIMRIIASSAAREPTTTPCMRIMGPISWRMLSEVSIPPTKPTTPTKPLKRTAVSDSDRLLPVVSTTMSTPRPPSPRAPTGPRRVCR